MFRRKHLPTIAVKNTHKILINTSRKLSLTVLDFFDPHEHWSFWLNEIVYGYPLLQILFLSHKEHIFFLGHTIDHIILLFIIDGKKHVQILHNDITEILLKLALNINQWDPTTQDLPPNAIYQNSIKRHQPRRRMSIRTTLTQWKTTGLMTAIRHNLIGCKYW